MAADRWNIQIATEDTFSAPIIDETVFVQSFQPASDLGASTLHYWRVRAGDGVDWSDWSVVWAFATQGATQTNTSTTSLDALVQEAGLAKTTTLDALVQRTGLAQPSTLDALVQAQFQASLGTDALVQAVKQNQLSLDALVQLLGNSRQISIDALVQAVKENQLSLDSFVYAVLASSVGLDAIVEPTPAGEGVVIVSLDALLQNVGLASSIGLDAYVGQLLSGQISIDAFVQATGTSSIGLDAIVGVAAFGVVSLDSLIQFVGVQVETSIDALVSTVRSGQVSFDAIVSLLGSTVNQLDAVIQATMSRPTSLDAIIGALVILARQVIEAEGIENRLVVVPATGNRIITLH